MGENVNLDKLCFRQVKVYQTGWIYINKRLKRKHDIKRKQFLEGNTEEFSSKFNFSCDVGLLDLRSRESTIELIQNYELSKCVWNSSEMEDRGRKQEVCWAHHHFPAIAGFFFFFFMTEYLTYNNAGFYAVTSNSLQMILSFSSLCDFKVKQNTCIWW